VNHTNGAKRLLAVDDNSDSAELIARVAVKCGYEARSVTNPSSLGDVLHNWKPQVLTLDLCMPEEDGISLLSLLKSAGFTGSLIIISGQDDWFRKTASRLASARGLNVAQDLPKPVDLKTLREVLTGLANSE
jgi:two-component system chemotaxis response regulator CheB